MGAGRPTKYRAEYAKQAYKLALGSFTDKQIADFFEIDEKTLNNWKKKFPSFFQSLKRGKQIADATVADSLYQRANGYKHKAVKIMQFEGQSFEHEYTEHYPPDTTACIFWLKNRQPETWRDKQIIDAGEKAASHFHEMMEMWKKQPHKELPIDASE